MNRQLPRLGAALVIASAALLVSACGSAEPDAAPTPDTSETSPAPEPTQPEQTPEPAPAGEEADPTCETIIDETTVADFESIGWTSRADPFYIGSHEVPDGLVCVWADFDAPASDHLQMFGWARVDDALSRTAQDELIAQGWIREQASEGVYITENPQTTIATDAQGYGMTYLFADGTVKLADTKQGLLLVTWPKG